MKNPYEILELSQDATQAQIARAQVTALRTKKYSMKEITEAQATLRKPSSRLAADFTFPVFEVEKMSPISLNITVKDIDWEKVDENKFNSLSI